MVTAETAATIPALLAVFALLLAGFAAAVGQGQACFAARTAARAVAVGESNGEALSLAEQAVRGVSVGIEHGASSVTVTAQVSALVPISCTVTAQKELHNVLR